MIYIQNSELNKIYKIDYNDYKIRPNDFIKIDILSETLESEKILNSNSINQNSNYSRQSLMFSEYKVDQSGYINYPNLGKIYVAGQTLTEFEKTLSQMLSEKGVLIKSSIDLKVLNMGFTILGEVNSPGKYFYDDENLNIMEAIGMAGDLTINGKRDGIKLIRDIQGNKTVYELDLTKANILKNTVFQISSGDVIIVDPNSARIKNAGIIGNSGTLLSLLSFLLSSIIVIGR